MGVDLSHLRRRELAQAIMATAAMEPLSTALPHGPTCRTTLLASTGHGFRREAALGLDRSCSKCLRCLSGSWSYSPSGWSS